MMSLKGLKGKDILGLGNYEFYDKTRANSPKYSIGPEKRGYVKKSEISWPWAISITCFKKFYNFSHFFLFNFSLGSVEQFIYKK